MLSRKDWDEPFTYGFGRQVSHATIPSYYTPEEVARVFFVVDRATPVGKRDYLMLCLPAIYGIRIGEIVDLRPIGA